MAQQRVRTAQQIREAFGVFGQIVFFLQQHILKRHAAVGFRDVGAHRVDQVTDRIPLIDRHHVGAQLVVGRMQRNREVHLKFFFGEFENAGHQADRRHGEAARAHVKSGGIVQPFDRRPPVRVVVERFAHAHEHHVAERLRQVGGEFAFFRADGAQLPRRPHHLLDDLAAGEVVEKPEFARRAKGAGHRTARLRGHTHRRAVGIHHQHRLDRRSVRQREQRLAGQPVVAVLLPDML